MSLVLLLALQSATSASPAPPAPVPIDFDLAKVKPSDRCSSGPGGGAGGGGGEGGGSEIVVCGHRPSTAFDLEKWARVYETGPLRAETEIAPGVVARAYTESVPMPQGQISKRAMVGLKVKF